MRDYHINRIKIHEYPELKALNKIGEQRNFTFNIQILLKILKYH